MRFTGAKTKREAVVIALVDSSLWVDFLRQAPGSAPDLEVAVREGHAAICPVVWMELWGGVRGKLEEAALQEMRGLCLWLEMDAATWTHAADLNRLQHQCGVLSFPCKVSSNEATRMRMPCTSAGTARSG